MRPTGGSALLRLALALCCLAAAAPAQGVVINEVYTGNPDYVEILNLGTATVDIGGWTLHSSYAFSTYPATLFTPGTTIAPGEALLILEIGATIPPFLPAPPTGTQVVHSGFNWGWVGNSAGALALVDASGVGRDLVVFGSGATLVPGSGFGLNFSGVVDRSDNDVAIDNVVQRQGMINTLSSGDWGIADDAGATPGTANPTQGSGPLVARSLVLSPTGGLISFPTTTTFEISATVTGIGFDGGIVISDPQWDPLIGGQVAVSGQFSLAQWNSLGGAIFAPALLSLQAAGTGPDSLTFVALYQSQDPVDSRLGGPAGSTPQHRRRMASISPLVPQRTGGGSAVLDGWWGALGAGSLDLVFRLGGANGPRLEEVGIGLAVAPGNWQARVGQGLAGQVEVGVVNAGAGVELYHVFVINPTYAPGQGPIAGIDFGPLQFELVNLPIGSAPFHVTADSWGAHHFLSAPGALPPGYVIDFLPVRVAGGQVEVLPPQRAGF